MKVYRSWDEIKKPFKKPVVAIGNFDGVHLGHQEILRQAVETSRQIVGTAVAYTFHPHPSSIIRPEACQPQLTSLEDRLSLMGAAGVDVTVVENFNREFSEKSAQEFFDDIIVKRLKAVHLYVGFNFFFGKGREGTPERLQSFCRKAKIDLTIVKPFQLKGETISSSKIRSFLQAGDSESASDYLGRLYFIRGLVIKGVQRGKTLGIPTANLKTEAQVIPKMGVYMTWAEVGGKKYQSLTNVGHAPTFAEKTPFSIETYLLNFDHDIYGEELVVHFLKRLRDTHKFPSPEALVAQIKKDIDTAKDYFRKIG